MLDNGKFKDKPEVIIGKMKYLDDATKERVKSAFNEFVNEIIDNGNLEENYWLVSGTIELLDEATRERVKDCDKKDIFVKRLIKNGKDVLLFRNKESGAEFYRETATGREVKFDE